ncbi:MAG: hypothetical protein IJ165_03815, partial [Proteobacteria bacterium]|nr:hypothetical protein [Pseudomonadota bacterium]
VKNSARSQTIIARLSKIRRVRKPSSRGYQKFGAFAKHHRAAIKNSARSQTIIARLSKIRRVRKP